MDNMYEVGKKYLPKRSKSDEYLETANEYYGRLKKTSSKYSRRSV